jgi:hypothetical protein
MTEPALAVIADPGASESRLLEAIKTLGPADEPPSFWRKIAQAEGRPDFQRAHAVFQLLRRHAKPGMTLADFAELLGDGAWASGNAVEIVSAVAGELPVRWTPDDTVFVLRPTPASLEFAVYVRVTGKIPLGSFRRLLAGGDSEEAVREAQVREIGFAAPTGAPPAVSDEA